MPSPLHHLLYQTGTVFALWEAQALCPKGVKGSEYDRRYTVALVISDLRHGRQPRCELVGVRLLLEDLLWAQLQPGNLIATNELYSDEELDKLERWLDNTTGPESWSKLVLALGHYRRLTTTRRDKYEAREMAADYKACDLDTTTSTAA
ncbi:hypothetical protein [Hymenobacter psychrophilus]|uniref:Uncharacterized protein n=1 Tax=Hymenobacter psychrophilus TaxID=651662 RepID=A0A1H3PE28_9BACT|nr:hypothetical protein [Hymenobacter psychrophilus]SDY99298.1 hypothetical protein SAMN04488069_12915 [Hymenobacter psychrophilus]